MNHRIYQRVYALYRRLHDAYGTPQWSGSMYSLMKELLDIRDEVRRSL